MRNISDKDAEKFKTHILWPITFFSLKARSLLHNAEKYGTAIQEANGNTTWRTPVACWVSNAADMHS